MTTDPGTASRLQAIRILVRWLEQRDFPDRMLPGTADRGFVMDLVYGTVRGWRRLEWALAPFVKRRPTSELRAALLLGAQQLLFMPDVADHAALHATVEAAKHGVSGQSGFVNAVLRAVLRRREALLAELAAQPLAVRTSHPDALVDRWSRVFGADAAAAICDWDNTPAETVVAVVPSCGVTAADLLARWQAAGVAARLHAAGTSCLVLGHGTRLETLEGYAEGWFVPQDPATLAAVRLLRAEPGLRVLDACAAPGGKTAQLAGLMRGTGTLVAMERHGDRIGRLRENLTRLGHDRWVQVIQGDAGQPEAIPAPGRFDRILLDAPCSNTGVLRRRPDARWRFSEARLRTLVAQQRRLLANLLPCIEPGGVLVYSTCSIEPEENQELVAAVCAGQDEFVRGEIHAQRPGDDDMDGAFACAIHRKPLKSAACSPG
jgi:16S rRNA (cytosine967-C5)-methyltransferase